MFKQLKAPEPKFRGWCQNNKLLQLVSRHSQTVCYIHKRTLKTLAIDVAEVVGLAVVASAELMIKPAAGFSKIVLCEISPINVLVHVIEYLTHCCLLIFFFFYVLHNFNYFDNAKIIIFWILCKFFNIKNHQKVIFTEKKPSMRHAPRAPK